MSEAVNFKVADLLAKDMARGNIDRNEGQKALSYLCKTRNPKEYFHYLRTVIDHGEKIIQRSDRTINYYKNLLGLSQYHLKNMDYEEMAQTLGWALRLAAYYKTLSDNSHESKQETESGTQERAKPKIPTIPQVGEVFAGKVVKLDETAVVVEIAGFTPDKAMGVLQAEQIPDGRTNRYKAGNSARVEVISIITRKNGFVIVELKPAAKEKSS